VEQLLLRRGEPVTQVRGPDTGMMSWPASPLTPRIREVFAVQQRYAATRMDGFPTSAEGHVKPKRILFVPHGSWGVGLNRVRDESLYR